MSGQWHEGGWYKVAMAEADRADKQAELITSLLSLCRRLADMLEQYTDIANEEEELKEIEDDFLSVP